MQIDWIVEFTHGQFGLNDAADCSKFSLTDEQLANQAAVNEDLTGFTVFSPRYSRFLRLQIEVTDGRPSMDFEEWDHVVELCFTTLSGELEMSTTCGNRVYDTVSREHLRGVMPVDPGIYQVYVLYANLASMQRQLSDASGQEEYGILMYGQPSDDDAAIPDLETINAFDHYRIVMWPVQDKVIKRHNQD